MSQKEAGRFSQLWSDRLVAVLRRRAGRQLADAERNAGVQPGYLRKAQSASVNVMLRKFLRICEEAQVEPGDVFAEVFPKTDYDSDFGLPVPNRPLPKIAKMALQQWEAPPMLPMVNEAWLEWLDELRYEDPKATVRIAEEAVEVVQTQHTPRLLGIWASACRPLCRHEDAVLVLREALRLARLQMDRLSEADLLRRGAALVVSASANYVVALKIVELASALYARSGEIDRLGCTLVNQGIFLTYMERYSEAKTALESGVKLLDPRTTRERIAALQVLGLIAQEQDRPEVALELSSRALKLVTNRYQVGKLRWLQGCALADLGQWNEAHESFEIALEQLLRPSPVDASLSACDHVRMLIDGGRIEQARSQISAMRRLMEPLADNLIASAAIRDLVRSEQEGARLTTVLVQRIIRRIEESRRAEARRR